MRKISITVFAVLLSLLVLNVYADQVKQAQEAGKEKEMALLDLFDSKCTKCHDVVRSQALHNSGRAPHDVVKRMQKKGAKITDEQVDDISEALK